MVLSALTDVDVPLPHPKRDPDITHHVQPSGPVDREPGSAVDSVVQPSLPPPGPRRARATLISEKVRLLDHGRVLVELACPPVSRAGVPGCTGVATMTGATTAVHYALAPGETARKVFHLTNTARAKLHSDLVITIRTLNSDATDKGTPSTAVRTLPQ